MTSYPPSITKAAKAGLFTMLSTALAGQVAYEGSPVLVSYCVPGKNQPPDIVAIEGARRRITASAMVGTMGAGSLQDDVDITVRVSVYRGGEAAQACFERACDLVDIVVNTVRADPSLGGAVLRTAPTDVEYGDAEPAAGSGAGGRVCECEITFAVMAII